MLPVARYTPRRRAVVLWRRHLSAVPRCLLLTWCPTPSPAVAARWRWRGVAGGAGGRVGWAFGMIASPFDANVSPPLCWLAPGAPHRLLRASGVSRSIGPHHTVRAPGVVEEEGVRALTPLVSPSLLPPPPPPPLLPTAGWRHSPPAVAVTAPPPIPPAARAVAAFQRRQPVAATGQGRHSVGPPRSLEGRTFGKAAPGPPPATAGRRTRGSVAPAATPPACEQRAAISPPPAYLPTHPPASAPPPRPHGRTRQCRWRATAPLRPPTPRYPPPPLATAAADLTRHTS